MAHFAQVNEFDIVQRVIVVADSDCLDANGQESEAVGAAYCHNLLGGRWLQTSYNNNMRVRFAGIGYKYDAVRNAYIPPQPYLSWIFDETTLDWVAPIPYPTDGKSYVWDEAIQNWVEVPTPQ
jgi:hypothetical protein